jgi:hypothetical protein
MTVDMNLPAGREVMGQIIQLESPGAGKSLAVAPDHRQVAIRTDAVHVVFTSIDETLRAVQIAGGLAKALGVSLTLILTRTVPRVLAVNAPTGLSSPETDVLVDRLQDAGREAGVDVRVRVYLCRHVQHVVPLAFKPHSLIVMAGQRSWWPTPTERWRRSLEAAGHSVVFVCARRATAAPDSS